VPQIRAVLDALQGEGCVAVSPDTYRLVSITPKGRDVMLRRHEGFSMLGRAPNKSVCSRVCFHAYCSHHQTEASAFGRTPGKADAACWA
jgi:hypothetical protein